MNRLRAGRSSRAVAPVGGKVGLMLALVCACAAARRAPAQTTWNDSTTRALVELATLRRAQQLADTGLADYRADAHGYVTFLAQLGEGFLELPRIVKADELALEVYWRAPNLSKQRIIGRRDTLLLPTDIAYHRDHLGIVQNNFPAIIRLGDGDEVRDVPHPLSPAGLGAYDFTISDSLRIQLPGRTLNVYEVKVRPRDERAPRVIGAVYIDRTEGQVVRMALSFTRAAFKDAQLEDLSIVLENGLVGARFWLPRRQEIEIRRTGTWLDYPVRGIIRGRWEIENYRINVDLPRTVFGNVEIVQAPLSEQRAYQWPSERVLDSLPPDVRAVTDADVKRVQAEARALVRRQALQRSHALVLSAPAISDLARIDRVEGLAVGAGFSQRLGHGVDVSAYARYGVDDEAVKGRARLAWQSGAGARVRATVMRDFRELGDVAERSRIVNSLAAQEFGSDYTDPVLVQGASFEVERAPPGGLVVRLEGGFERPRALQVRAIPASGRFEPLTLPDEHDAVRVGIVLERPARVWIGGWELGAAAHAGAAASVGSAPGACGALCAPYRTARFALVANLEKPFGARRLVARSIGAAAVSIDGPLPPQALAYFGGPVSAPGYDFHALVGRAGFSQRLEWRTPFPFFSIPLGRYGATPRSATLAPYVQAVALQALPAAAPAAIGPGRVPHPSGVYPTVGIGLLTVFDILRLDVARGLRHGRWTFAVDVTPDFWRVL